MQSARPLSPVAAEHQPTIIEAELDSICWSLGKMAAKVQRTHLLDHLTQTERAGLEAALERAQDKLFELSTRIRK